MYDTARPFREYKKLQGTCMERVRSNIVIKFINYLNEIG